MPLFHQHKVIFIHIPKTAGTSITSWLGYRNLDYNIVNLQYLFGKYNNLQLQHLKYNQLSCFIDKDIIDSYHYLVVIRNPKDRLLSEYYWLKNHSFWSVYLSNQLTTLETFLQYLLSKQTLDYEFVHWHKQVDFIKGLNITSDKVHIIIFDKLIHDLDNFIKKTGIILSTNSLPKLNSCNNYEQELTKEQLFLIDEVLNKFYLEDKLLYNQLSNISK